MRVFAFLNLEHPAVAWAVMRGKMLSADHAYPTREFAFISFMQAGMIEYQNNARIFNETIVEQVRAQTASDRVSRMRGMYFFRTQQEAEARIADQNWPPYFVAENLLELELQPSGTPSVLDANWITFAPLDVGARLKLNELDWIGRYWAGEQYSSEPVWELLANGEALILDSDVRRKCNDYVTKIFPRSQIPILMARIASEVRSMGGSTSPFLRRKDDQHVELIYLWTDADFHDRQVIDRVAEHPDSKLLANLMAKHETWDIPDFRPWSRTYTVGYQVVSGGNRAVVTPSVHHSAAGR
jgi:hypothetical protein